MHMFYYRLLQKRVKMSQFLFIFALQQQQRPDLSRLMQLQAAGAGLPTSMAAGGLPPGFLPAAAANSAAAASALAAASIPGMPPGFLTGGMPPASVAAQMAAAGIRPPGMPPVTSSAELALRAATASREEEAVKLGLSKLFSSKCINH